MLQSNSPTTLMFPPFRGVTRRIVLLAILCFVVTLVLNATPLGAQINFWLVMTPAVALFHKPWQLLTYAFIPTGLLSTVFALLSMWMFGSQMEDDRGPRWMTEFFLVSAVGGALLAALLGLSGLLYSPLASTAGLWPAIMALLLAFARAYPDQQIRLFGLLGIKAKHLVAIYLVFYLFSALRGGDKLGAATALFAALCGYLYLRFVPRRGLGTSASERLYGMRNAYYRSKRQRAARKFTVYMRKQGKDVNIDSSGKYVGLDDERKNPNDKRWMN